MYFFIVDEVHTFYVHRGYNECNLVMCTHVIYRTAKTNYLILQRNTNKQIKVFYMGQISIMQIVEKVEALILIMTLNALSFNKYIHILHQQIFM
jgi:hypothetical protein